MAGKRREVQVPDLVFGGAFFFRQAFRPTVGIGQLGLDVGGVDQVQTLRSEFQGASTDLRPIGCGFESAPKLTVSLTSDKSEAVFDLAALTLPPGDYLVAFQGSAVAKYRHHPEAVAAAEVAKRQAEQMVMALDAESKKLAEVAATATPEAQAETEKSKTEIAEKQKAAAAALAAADEKLKQATAIAQPQDIVDIVTTEPIALRVKPAESK